MAEAFTVAAGVVGVVGLAGHVAQGVKYLRQVVGEIRNAPAEIKDLINHLDVLEIIIDSIKGRLPEGDGDEFEGPGFRPALEQCCGAVEALRVLIKQCNLVEGERRSKRLWKKFLVVDKGAEFASCLRRLESAKSSLICAQSSQASTIGHRIFQATRTASQTAHENLNAHAYTQNAVAAVLMNQQYIMAAFEQQILGNGTLQRVVEQQQFLSSRQQVFEESNRQYYAPRGAVTESGCVESSNGYSVELRTRPTALAPPADACQSSAQDDTPIPTSPGKAEPRWPTAISHRSQSTGNRYNNWFGSVTVTTHETTTREYDDQTGKVSRHKTVHRTHTFLRPSSWLLCRGAMVTVTSVTAGDYKLSPRRQLETFNIVPWNSPILEACRNLDIATVRQLFLDGKASPSDRSYNGLNLVYITILENFFNRQWRQSWSKQLELIQFLLDCGVKSVEYHCNTFEIAWHLDWYHGSYGSYDATLELGRLLFKEATENPSETHYSAFSPRAMVELLTQSSWPVDWGVLSRAQTRSFTRRLGPQTFSKIFTYATQSFQPGLLYQDDYDVLVDTLNVLWQFSKEDLWTSGFKYLVMLLKQGAYPFYCAACHSSLGSPTDVAHALGLTGLWEKALDEADYNGRNLIQDEGYEGIDKLFTGLEYEGWECIGCRWCGEPPGQTCIFQRQKYRCGCCTYRTNYNAAYCPGGEERWRRKEQQFLARREAEEREARPSAVSRIATAAVDVLTSIV